MNLLKQFFQPSSYEPIHSPQINNDDSYNDHDDDLSSSTYNEEPSQPFSWLTYTVFLLIGIAMLWAWNMFFAASPYFQHRLQSSPWLLDHFQAAIISVGTSTNLVGVLILSKLQENASYPTRITSALIINAISFTILAMSTLIETSTTVYFIFLLFTILTASLSTGLIQNGVFALASGFGRSEYTQAIMLGQGISGVLPPLTQIISVRATSETGVSDTAAFTYFITATGVSLVALVAFLYLVRTTKRITLAKSQDLSASIQSIRSPVGLWELFRKLPYLSSGVFLCLAVTMVGFPVFTAIIYSVGTIENAVFVPIAFLVWNVGDFVGRLGTISKRLSLTHYPVALFCIAGARLVFIPLYLLCNVKGRGAVVASDLFYLGVVQFLFGLSNGYLGSSCMMGAGDWVDIGEREAAGGFMGLMLVGGLTVGSLLSFTLSGL